MKAFIRGQAELQGVTPEFLDRIKKGLRVTNPKYVSATRFGSRYAAQKIPKMLQGYTELPNGSIVVPRRWLLAYREEFGITCVNQTVEKACEWPIPTLDLYDYQERAADAYFEEVNQNDAQGLPTDGMVVLATSAGKTVLGMFLAYHSGERTLVVVPTKEIEAAWVEDCSRIFQINPKQIGRIRGKTIDIKDPFTIGSVQTLMALDPRLWANQFGMLICDEAHRLPGESFVKVLRNSNARLRVGLTATDNRKDGLMPAVRWHLGKNVYRDLTPRNSVPLIYNGVLTDSVVQPLRYDGGEPIYDYNHIIASLVTDQARNNRIINLVNFILQNYGGDILISSCRVDHIEELADQIKTALNVTVATLTGRQGNRKQLYQHIKDGHYRVTIATQQIVAEGASNPRWWHVISTTPFSDSKTMVQLKGRPIRKDPNDPSKKHGYFWDLVDNVQMCRNMGRTRYSAVKPHTHQTVWYDLDHSGLSEHQRRGQRPA